MQRRAPSRSMLCRRKRNKNARRKDRSGTERVVRKPGSASETKRDRRILARHAERLDKARDEGLKLYLQFAPEKDREKQRLQFLGDVAAVRLAYLEAGWVF